MIKHSDAIGYLLDLKEQINQDWFTYICEQAISATNTNLTESEVNSIMDIFLGESTFSPSIPKSHDVHHTISSILSSSQPKHLNEISEFNNFKKLSDSIRLTLDKRITLVFGHTGAGKSSLLEAIKILANPELPASPIHNANNKTFSTTSFKYKFNGDSSFTTWDQNQGYGKYANQIKYFDSSLALRYVNNSVLPEQFIELMPFKLHVFEFARSFILVLRQRIESKIYDEENHILLETEKLKNEFANFSDDVGRVIKSLDKNNYLDLQHFIDNEPFFNKEQLLSLKKEELTRIQRLTSEEGIKLSKAELRELELWNTNVTSFYESAKQILVDELFPLKTSIKEKENRQITISTVVIPSDVQLDKFKNFLKSLNEIFDFSLMDDKPCPACRRELDKDSRSIFEHYHEFLTNSLEQEITTANSEFDVIWKKLQDLKKHNVQNLKKSIEVVSIETRKNTRDIIAVIKRLIPVTVSQLTKDSFTGYKKYFGLLDVIKQLKQNIKTRTDEINIAEQNRSELSIRVAGLKKEIESLEFRKKIIESKSKINKIITKFDKLSELRAKLEKTNFTAQLKKLTEQSKKAHKELIVSQFESTLDSEYYALSEKHLSDFNVTLPIKGDETIVTIEPNVGGNPIQKILSEGEQRLHALAIYFCELQFQNHGIIVFDDPVSSFDYSYIGQFSFRLREYAKQRPNNQIIVFTHNWEFFIQLQEVLNKANLADKISIQVLEGCSYIQEYKDNIEGLKRDIDQILTLSREPTKSEKENIARNMRILIEAIINTHVFNNERHSYKRKTLNVSTFEKFKYLIPLNDHEATKLRDFYLLLSIPEHDDPRNSYINWDQPIFRNRYDEIMKIESSILTRMIKI